MQASKELREAFRFHLEHDGYCTPPGRAACALKTAKAMLRAEYLEGEGLARWIVQEGDHDHLDEKDPEDKRTLDMIRHGSLTSFWVCLERRDNASCDHDPDSGRCSRSCGWTPAASVGGVFCTGWRDPYLRVVKGELATEAGLEDPDASPVGLPLGVVGSGRAQ